MAGMEGKVMQLEWRKKYFLMDMTSVAMKKWLEKTDMTLLPAGSCDLNHRGNAALMDHVARKVRYDAGALVVLFCGEGIAEKAATLKGLLGLLST